MTAFAATDSEQREKDNADMQHKKKMVGKVNGARLLIEAPAPVEETNVVRLKVLVYNDERDMGLASALHFAVEQCRLVAENGSTSIMLMAAPSAFPFYNAYIRLAESSAKIRAALHRTHFFQFDDYALPFHSAASFRFLLCRHFLFPLAEYCDAEKVHLFEADAVDSERACREYAELLMAHGPDLQLKGTGENGHWGFHEPGIPIDTKPCFMRVALSQANIAQQMRDHPRLFPTPESVPTEAFTANVPLFMRARVLIEDNVPQASKAFALLAAYGSEVVDAAVPSSALKQHPNAILRATRQSAWALLEYSRTQRVSSAMLRRLVNAATSTAGAEVAQLRRRMRAVLDKMHIVVSDKND